MERGSHAWGVYPTQDTSRMGTARLKQEEETDTRIILREYLWKYGRKEHDHYNGENSQTMPN